MGTVSCGTGGKCVNVFKVPEEKCKCTPGFKSKNCSQGNVPRDRVMASMKYKVFISPITKLFSLIYNAPIYKAIKKAMNIYKHFCARYFLSKIMEGM